MRARAILATLMVMAGCAPEPEPTIPATWIGRWNGPEGTWIEIQAAQTGYEVTIRNLDGARSFPAAATADGLAFERDGSREILRATDGAGTGMKWLLEKSDCLALRTGEGYCRD